MATIETTSTRIAARWPRPSEVNTDQVVLSYDHDSDTGFVHLFGRGRNAVSDSWYVLVDPSTSTVPGLQIEEFLTMAIIDVPRLVRLLDLSELRGITPADVSRECNRIMHGYRERSTAEPQRWLPPEKRKRALIRHMLEQHRPAPEPDVTA